MMQRGIVIVWLLSSNLTLKFVKAPNARSPDLKDAQSGTVEFDTIESYFLRFKAITQPAETLHQGIDPRGLKHCQLFPLQILRL